MLLGHSCCHCILISYVSLSSYVLWHSSGEVFSTESSAALQCDRVKDCATSRLFKTSINKARLFKKDSIWKKSSKKVRIFNI